MSIGITDNQHYSDIADAIRGKGVTGSFKPSEMAAAIESIPSGGGDLPEEYQEVEWVQSDGSASIDTGFVMPTNYTCHIKIYVEGAEAATSNVPIWGPFASTQAGAYIGYDSGYKWGFAGGVNSSTPISSIFEADYSYDESSHTGTLISNGETIRRSGATITRDGNMRLFQNTASGSRLKVRHYRLPIYDENGNLDRVYIPCYRKFTGTIGIYDTKNLTLRTATGEHFSKGPDVVSGNDVLNALGGIL